MIPDIGVLIGAYIALRCVEMLCKPAAAFSSAVARSITSVLAMLTIVVTAVIVYDLVSRGSNLPVMPGLSR
jgi:uncharacterized protein YqgC (DUF456 family)